MNKTKLTNGLMLYTCTQKEYEEHCNSYDGLCTECGEWTFGCVEPDAEGCECECCGSEAVMGAENALVTGGLGFSD